MIDLTSIINKSVTKTLPLPAFQLPSDENISVMDAGTPLSNQKVDDSSCLDNLNMESVEDDSDNNLEMTQEFTLDMTEAVQIKNRTISITPGEIKKSEKFETNDSMMEDESFEVPSFGGFNTKTLTIQQIQFDEEDDEDKISVSPFNCDILCHFCSQEYFETGRQLVEEDFANLDLVTSVEEFPREEEKMKCYEFVIKTKPNSKFHKWVHEKLNEKLNKCKVTDIEEVKFNIRPNSGTYKKIQVQEIL